MSGGHEDAHRHLARGRRAGRGFQACDEQVDAHGRLGWFPQTHRHVRDRGRVRLLVRGHRLVRVAVSSSDTSSNHLVARLRSIAGDGHVITQEHQLRTYESDGLLQYRASPRAVVLPGSAQEVQQVVAACHEAEIPWVARGAGSGLSGGALPVEEGVLIALTRMRRILDVNLDDARVTVEPGVTNIEVSNAVGPTYTYPPDPSSQIVCSIGGNVAENAGGAHCFKYGFTTNYVTGLEVVLPDGEMMWLGGPELDPAGLDLTGTFVGSEGTLGVATKAILRVVPAPEAVRTLVAFFGSPPHAGEVVSGIVSRSEEHTSELQSHSDLVCRLLLEKKKKKKTHKNKHQNQKNTIKQT